MKTYILQIDSPEYPKGTEARESGHWNHYDIYSPQGTRDISNVYLDTWQIEGRPEMWKLKEEKKEKKEVNEYAPFIPALHEEYFFVQRDGHIGDTKNVNFTSDDHNIELGVFRTREAAGMEKLREQSRANMRFPENGASYYCINIRNGEIESHFYMGDYIDTALCLMGNCHETEEDAQTWKDKYYEAFRVLFS